MHNNEYVSKSTYLQRKVFHNRYLFGITLIIILNLDIYLGVTLLFIPLLYNHIGISK